MPLLARACRLTLRFFDGIHGYPFPHRPAIHVTTLQHGVGIRGGLDIIGMC